MRLVLLVLAVAAHAALIELSLDSRTSGPLLWSDPGTWLGGTIPNASDSVLIDVSSECSSERQMYVIVDTSVSVDQLILSSENVKGSFCVSSLLVARKATLSIANTLQVGVGAIFLADASSSVMVGGAASFAFESLIGGFGTLQATTISIKGFVLPGATTLGQCNCVPGWVTIASIGNLTFVASVIEAEPTSKFFFKGAGTPFVSDGADFTSVLLNQTTIGLLAATSAKVPYTPITFRSIQVVPSIQTDSLTCSTPTIRCPSGCNNDGSCNVGIGFISSCIDAQSSSQTALSILSGSRPACPQQTQCNPKCVGGVCVEQIYVCSCNTGYAGADCSVSLSGTESPTCSGCGTATTTATNQNGSGLPVGVLVGIIVGSAAGGIAVAVAIILITKAAIAHRTNAANARLKHNELSETQMRMTVNSHAQMN